MEPPSNLVKPEAPQWSPEAMEETSKWSHDSNDLDLGASWLHYGNLGLFEPLKHRNGALRRGELNHRNGALKAP